MDMCLDNAYLQMGANHVYRRGSLAQQYAMYSDNYEPNVVLDIANIYKHEVLDVKMGHLANISNCQCHTGTSLICLSTTNKSKH